MSLSVTWLPPPDLGGDDIVGLLGAAGEFLGPLEIGEVELPAVGNHVALHLTSLTDHVGGFAASVSCPVGGRPTIGAGKCTHSRPHLLGWALPIEVAVRVS